MWTVQDAAVCDATSCADLGYFYPKDSPYNAHNRQDLECDGPTGQYRDLTNGGKFTRKPKACQREKGNGCKFLTQDKGYVEKEECPTGVPSLGDGCRLFVRCKDGESNSHGQKCTGGCS